LDKIFSLVISQKTGGIKKENKLMTTMAETNLPTSR